MEAACLGLQFTYSSHRDFDASPQYTTAEAVVVSSFVLTTSRVAIHAHQAGIRLRCIGWVEKASMPLSGAAVEVSAPKATRRAFP